jgi:hypothetical protein
MARISVGRTLGTACATWAIGLPLALAAIIWGLDALIWVLEHLPQN